MIKGPSVDVLVCGAGAAGLTLAIELARRNVSFRLIDRLGEPFRGSRGKGMMPRTLEVLEDLGILDRLSAAGGLYPPQRDYRVDGTWVDSDIIAHDDSTPAEPYRTTLMVPQFVSESVMRQRLAELGSVPEYGFELVALEQDKAGVTARLEGNRGPEAIRVRYLVGADGGRSFVRHALGIGFPGKTLGVRAVAADVILTGLGRDAWHRFNEGSMDAQISLCPLAGTSMFQLQAPVPLEGEIDLSAEALNRMVAERSARGDIRIQSVSWASAFSMHARLADRYRVGRVFLAGDAAHVHPPTGGQGLNTSIQDSYNLGWKLAAVLAGAPEALLDTYEEERRPIAAGMLGLATRLLDAARRGDMRRGREVHQLDLGYPVSSLTMEQPTGRDGLVAGARAPDAPLRGAAGQVRRLFDLFRGTHWTLLAYDMDHCPVPRQNLHIHRIGARGDLIDADGHFLAAYAPLPGTFIVVRPDGYVGAILDAEDSNVLDSYLADVAGLRVQ